jgi:pyruvate/2-oxoacid:ferredoxin oxidoreductase beta subunit
MMKRHAILTWRGWRYLNIREAFRCRECESTAGFEVYSLFAGAGAKDIVAKTPAHGVPYRATASIAYPDDRIAKLTKAKSIRDTKFPHLYASCSTGRRHAPALSAQAACTTIKSRGVPAVSPVP